MRTLLAITMLLSACSQEQASESSIATGTFAGEGRNRLCITGQPGAYRGGLIAYGDGDINCSASGRIETQGEPPVLVPRGEGACRIPLIIEGNTVRIGEVPAACSYYCGPGARLTGKDYSRADMGAKAVDLTGDPLC